MEAVIRTRTTDPPYLEVLYELGAAEHALRAAVEARLPAPMSYTHYEVLRDFLRFGDGAPPAEIASRLRMSRGAVSHLLQRMEALGWIRLAGDDRDGRRKQVFLTPEGARMARAASTALRPGADRLKIDLSDNYLKEGLVFLQALRRSLESLSAGDGPGGSRP
ncbi:MAG: MarR family transcriptional regulator [Phenylobacterium sp.]|uniref:MarR family winged helix-turn-helix transcriptional regulator n=1 Tax=Phenylobacterium sp. TaxID=1871053 RepID=UPI0025E29F8C|nr:MarR family transcriptional regulator [Phenylobacterium sp.]MCA6226371.1 MarR family transcriptional regulator [Phenylobacterium sp.]MCA6235669.1 MarR family transcriptional regulator [Phenylobacterium sp.]MCA6250616.1 MarR family transcriptional regulator [Phenylobacterium sp.]MCA6252799.1 MarR family transcriptional regulator [Phenylobacterium sp.]MCA6258180.1 MarR family transcriptional regulator [Phenylobacterium sp.]